MTLMPLVIGGAFFASSWFALGGVSGKLLAFIFTATGIWVARAARRAMERARVRVDANGIYHFDGSRNGVETQRAVWDDVARCGIEKRSSSADSTGTPHIVLTDAAGQDLLALYMKYLSGADTTRLLCFIRTELERRNARFDVPV